MYIKAIKHIRRPRGGSQAQLMAADDGHEHVVKFKGNPQTTRVLANDYLAVGPNGRIERTRAGHHICRCRDHSGIQISIHEIGSQSWTSEYHKHERVRWHTRL